MIDIPKYLKKYIVEQNYDAYSFIDHACWRFIMRLNQAYFSNNAHDIYIDGLNKTGITINEIPKIKDMNEKMQKFGWSVVGVKGFLPPLIFMDFQSKGILPIACDIRSIEHLTYTPAPDIVHEAAGHSPMIANKDYADYLKYYGKIAKKAIYSSEDYNMYVAIRNLSDIKESPDSTKNELKNAELKLEEAIDSISYVSEAAYLSRINWWTVEYGLIGDIDNPKIYGAGLLSSVGESENCLTDKVKKIPLSINCINYSYDITEQQPQLFVSKDFKSLNSILDEISESMAYKIGGLEGFNKAIQSKSICTIELDSKIQVSGKVSNSINLNKSVAYMQLEGPTQICYNDRQIENHGTQNHPEGFGSPIGPLINNVKINLLSSEDFFNLGYRIDKYAKLEFNSGVSVEGIIKSILEYDSYIQIITFINCTVTYRNQILFDPKWGQYDMVCGQKIDSVFGGPADIDKYFDSQDDSEVINLNNKISPTNINKDLNQIYSQIKDMRINNNINMTILEKLSDQLKKDYNDDWLAQLEIYELVHDKTNGWVHDLRKFLEFKTLEKSDLAKAIQKSLQLINLIKV